MNQKVLEKIEESDLVLIGIGEEFSPAVPEYQGKPELELYALSRFYSELPENHEVLLSYESLRGAVEKNHILSYR